MSVPEVIPCAAKVRAWSRAARERGEAVALVPTMGNLHEGHLSLVEIAMAECPRVIVSIFVNPTQFGHDEDFSGYPRTFDEDLAKLEKLGVHAVFVPKVDELYPPGDRTTVSVGWGTDKLCGAYRPGHFDGVTNVVARLFIAVEPELAVFGQKDAQQSLVIQRMVQTLGFPVRLKLGPTLRESDGLAMSSRNVYLSSDERAKASILYRALEAVGDLLRKGERDPLVLEDRGKEVLSGLATEYFSVVDPATLERPECLDDGLWLVACAARLGRARLIDNHVYRLAGNEVREALLI